VTHGTSRDGNKRPEQDHRGIKGRYGPTRARKSPDAPGRFGRSFNELRNYLYPVQAVAETFQPPLAGNAFVSGIVAPRVLEAT